MANDYLKTKRFDGNWEAIGVRFEDGTVKPFKLKYPDGTWHTFAGSLTGAPLKQKQEDGTWKVVAREGEYVAPSFDVTVNLTVLDGDNNPIPHAKVIIGGEDGERYTDSSGHLTWEFTVEYEGSGKGVRSYKSTYEYKETVIYPTRDNHVFNITQKYSWRTASWVPSSWERTTGWAYNDYYEDYQRPDSDFAGQFGVKTSTTSASYGQGTAYASYSRSEIGTPPAAEFYYNFIRNTEHLEWFVIPLKLLKDKFAWEMSLTYPAAQLQSITITHRLFGNSFSADHGNYMWAQPWSITPTLLDGQGHLEYLGELNTPEEVVSWQKTGVYNQFSSSHVSYIASKGFQKDTGTTIWSGSLNNLGKATSFATPSRAALEVPQTIPVSSTALGLAFALYTDHTEDFSGAAGSDGSSGTHDNIISDQFVISFDFRY